MASVKNLKKDINFLMTEIISDCQLFILTRPDKKSEEADAIIDDTIELWTQLYEKVNNTDGKHEHKSVIKHYKSIEKDLPEKSHELFERSSSLSSKK